MSEARLPPLRVLVVAPFGVMGGAESWLLSLLRATDRLSVEAVLLEDGPFRGRLEELGIPVTVRRTGRTGAQIASRSAWLAGLLRRSSPEVVLANGVKAAAVAVPACRLLGVPVVWAKHDRAFDATLARPLGRLADRVVAVSGELALPTGRHDAVIIPPPRPETKPASRSAARRFWRDRGIPLDGGPVLGMIARLVPYKGVDDAIAALALPPARSWRLVVAGSDDRSAPGETDRLRSLSRELGVEDRVHFAGWVDGAGRWAAGFDAVAVLTRRDAEGFGGEGFPLAAVEAMLAGLPLVTVDWGPDARRMAEAAGTIVPPGDPGAVALALEQLTAPERRKELGRAAARLAEDHPSAPRCAALLCAAMAEAALRPGAGLGGGPPVSVVVTVLDEESAIPGLMDALALQLEAEDELIVVDGGSVDRTADLVRDRARTDPRVNLVSVPGANIPAGRNAGVAAARHAVIACTDAGCVPGNGWLAALRAPFAEPDPADLVAGVYRVPRDGLFGRAMAAAHYPDPGEARRAGPFTRGYWRLFGQRFDPTMPSTRSVAFTAEAAARAGGFPEGLDTAEDPVFGRAVAAGGGRCALQVAAEVAWRQRPTARATARMFYRYGVGGGLSGDRKLVGRDLARAGAYLAGPLLVWRGGRTGRAVVALGAGLYLSLPLRRALRGSRPALVAPLVPAALVLKDVAKATGCVAGLVRRWGRRGR